MSGEVSYSFDIEERQEKDDSFGRPAYAWLSPLWVMRKLVYYLLLTVCFCVDKSASLLGFSFQYELRDREAWNWEFSVPRYKAYLERKD